MQRHKTESSRQPRIALPAVSLLSGAGFTLIELIVVLTIIGIVAAIAGPSYQNFVESNRLTLTANDFMSDLSFARIEAMKRQGGSSPAAFAGQGQMVVCASANGSTCAAAPTTWASGWIVFWDQDADLSCCNAANGDALLKMHAAIPSGLTTAMSPNGAPLSLAFNRLGMFMTANGMNSLQITDAKINQTRVICFSGGNGRARITTGTCP